MLFSAVATVCLLNKLFLTIFPAAFIIDSKVPVKLVAFVFVFLQKRGIKFQNNQLFVCTFGLVVVSYF